VAADPDRLLQVLTNLLSNAVKFSPRNSTVSVLMRPDVNGVTLSVVDPGRGIPADKLESIFGRFQQVDASDARQKGGTGLGLAICRTIVHQHSGRIWAERNPVRGSAFRVFLPYKPVPIGTAEPIFDEEADQQSAAVPRELGPQLVQRELVG
jgi:signal transduction histidine kinase